uniref:Uncharacterized protein n=2 Tax=Ovis aries TaxID=9940 RepID=A0AC11EHP8_SHEEP
MDSTPLATLSKGAIYFLIGYNNKSKECLTVTKILLDPLPQFTFSDDISVQLLSRVQLFATPCTAAHQASLSITNSQSSPKLMSIESVMPSNHLILCRPLLLPSIFPSIRVFSNESAVTSGDTSTGVSALTSVLPMNTQTDLL